jgi:uncharacterized protein YbjT (DUF2867 family)
MKILVTGGTGVIGTAAVSALVAAGHSVRLLSRHADEEVSAFPGQVESFAADLADAGKLRGTAAGCDTVLHIAGILNEEPPELTYERVNVRGTETLLRAAEAEKAPPHFIFISSLGAERGRSAYHVSKRQAEELVRGYQGAWTILRPGNIYGPGDQTISLLLKMVRTLPAVPIVGDGSQRFQPLWHADFGRVLAQLAGSRQHTGRVLEIAGLDVTTTADVLDRLELLTGRHPPRIALPPGIAALGSTLLESFDAAGEKIVKALGLTSPLGTAKLDLLLEESVIDEPSKNALQTIFGVTPTPLDDGLAILADELPEQTVAQGFGALEESTYSAEIHGTDISPEQLIGRVADNLATLMPIAFAAEPAAPTAAREGETMTGAIPGRGHLQVRLEERTPTTLTFVTVEGHPLSGVLLFVASPSPHGVRFSVRVYSRASNAIDWAAMQVFGAYMQSLNWRQLVRNVVALSGGHAPGGVLRLTKKLDEADITELDAWTRDLINDRKRAERSA